MKVDISKVATLGWKMRNNLPVEKWNRIDYTLDKDRNTIFIYSSFYTNSHPEDVARKVNAVVTEIKAITGVDVKGEDICEKIDAKHRHLRKRYTMTYAALRRKLKQLAG